MGLTLTFLGAAKNVTGSCYLVDADGFRMLVDCGMYQERDLKHRNWDPFPVKPDSLDAVLLTHGHTDHCGLVPKFVKEGFKGKIYCTEVTADIAKIVLLDAAKIQAEDAAFKKKRHEREGRSAVFPEVPLYTVDDVQAIFSRFEVARYEKAVTLGRGVEAVFHDAGHILGSSSIEFILEFDGKRRTLLFSGDIGRWNTPILCDPAVVDGADYIVTESTYGDRIHDDNENIDIKLADIINEAWKLKGKIIIPSFAIERTQELLYRLNGLLADRKIPHVPVFVDSPMAIKVTEVFQRHPELFDEETLALIRKGGHPCDFPDLKMCRTTEESKAVNSFSGPAIIIAGSGMCTGGRIKHHLAQNIGKPKNTVLFVGYQAVGTLGRVILEGAREVRIHGQNFAVKAGVKKINGFSAHADRNEIFRWLSGVKRAPRRVFITHGEPDTAVKFSDWLTKETGWPTTVPSYLDVVKLD